jgi:ribosomal protein L7/L12
MGLFSVGGPDLGPLIHRLRIVERKLDLVLEHLGIESRDPPASALDQQVIDLVRSGRKIEAIKLYREQTGAGLKDAKDAVEQIAG